jgi:hypothetical protein
MMHILRVLATNLPLSRLLPELHQVLHPDGSLAVWTAVPGWSPGVVERGGLFAYLGQLNGVQKFRRLCENF